MIFNSLTFIIFLAIVVALYWNLPQKVRLWMIALGSLVFYGFWKPQYTLLLIFAAVMDYYIATPQVTMVLSPSTHAVTQKTSHGRTHPYY